MTLDRRRFLTVSAASITGSILAACDKNPKSAEPLLALAERANQRVEEGLFRHTAMTVLDANTPVAGRSFPKYFNSPRVPDWDTTANGVWRLEVSGAVPRPLSLALDDLMKLPRVTHKVDHVCVEGWNAPATWSGVRVSDLAPAAGITGDAQFVDFAGFDKGYHESWDMQHAMLPQP